MQKITTFLWYNGKVEEGARFYVSLFKNSKILRVAVFQLSEIINIYIV